MKGDLFAASANMASRPPSLMHPPFRQDGVSRFCAGARVVRRRTRSPKGVLSRRAAHKRGRAGGGSLHRGQNGFTRLFRLPPVLIRMVAFWAFFAVWFSQPPVQAAALYWTGAVSGTWNPLGNWSTVPSASSPKPLSLGATDSYTFNISSLTQDQTVYLGGNLSANALVFSNTLSTRILGGDSSTPSVDTLTLGGVGAGIIVNRGAGPVTMGDAAGLAKVNLVLGITGGGDPRIANHSNGNLTIANDIMVQGGSGLVLGGSAGAGAINTLSGAISASGLTFENSRSLWVVSGANAISGSVSLLGGALRLTHAQALGSAPLYLERGWVELAADSDTVFPNNWVKAGTVSSMNTIVIDRRTAGPGVKYSVGMLTHGTYGGFEFVAGGSVTSGVAEFALEGSDTSSNYSRFFLSLNSFIRPDVRTRVTLGSLSYSGTNASGGWPIFFDGPGDFVISSSLGRFGNLYKYGRGNLTLQGSGTGSNGYVVLDGGSLILDYANMPDSTSVLRSGTSAFFSGGTLLIQGRAGIAGSQDFGNVFLYPGGGRLLLQPNGASSMGVKIGYLDTDDTGGALLVGTYSSAGTVSYTGGLTNNLVSSRARVIFSDGSTYRFASRVSGAANHILAGTIGTPLTNTALTSTLNYELSGGLALTQGTASLNSLRIASTGPSQTLSSNGSLSLKAGGLLFVGGDDYTVTAPLTSGISPNGYNKSDLLIHQYGTGRLTLAGGIVESGTQDFTKTGPGTLVLSGSNQFTGDIYVNEGVLSVTGPGSVEEGWNALGTTAGRSIYLNGGTFQITGTGGYSLSNKRFSIGYGGAVLDVGSSVFVLGGTSGRIAGSGDLVLGGQTTSDGVLVGGTYNSSFSGDVYIQKGVVRLSTNVGLGNGMLTVSPGAALDLAGGSHPNRIVLMGSGTYGTGALLNSGSGTATVSGQIFLGSDVLIAGSITQFSSGVISDMGAGYGITKIGQGNLTLSGTNTFTGPLWIREGTLSVSRFNGLGVLGPLGNNGTALTLGSATGGTARVSYSGTTTFSSRPVAVVGGGTGDLNISSSTAVLHLTGPLTGAGDFRKTGAGTLGLRGDNTFTGSLWVQTGTLALDRLNDSSVAGPLGMGTLAVALGGSTNPVVGLRHAGTLSSQTNRPLNLLGGTALVQIVEPDVNVTLTGTVMTGVNSGTLWKTGAGTLSLAGNNTYAGSIVVSEGVLKIQNVNALGSVGSWTSVRSGGALQIEGGITTPEEGLRLAGTGVANTGALRNVSGNNTYAGSITLTGAATIGSDAGTLTLSHVSAPLTGANTDLTVAGPGDVAVSGPVNLGGGTLFKTGGGSLLLSGLGSTYAGSLWMQEGLVDVRTTGGLTLSGSLTGSGTLAKTGGGTLFVSGANSQFAGTFTLVEGSVPVSSESAFGAGALRFSGGTFSSDSDTARLFSNSWWMGGTVTMGTAGAMGSLTFTGNGTLLSGASLVTVSMVEWSGRVLSGGNGLVKTGANVLVLSNAGNDLSGGLTVGGGTVEAGVGGLGGAGVITLQTGTLRYGLGNTEDYSSRLVLVEGGVPVVDTNGNDVAFDSAFGSGITSGWSKVGAGTLTLGAANTFAGSLRIGAGAVRLTHGDALGAVAGATTVEEGAALIVDGGITVGAEGLTLSGTGVANTGALRNVGGNNTYAGSITLTGAATIGADAGTLTLSRASAPLTGADTDLTVAGSGDVTVNGPLQLGTGNLLKTGPGKLTLGSAASTYSGSLWIQEGVLSVGSLNKASVAGPLGSNAGSIAMGNSGGVMGTLSYTAATGTTSARPLWLVAGGTGGFEVAHPDANVALSTTGTLNGEGEFRKLGPGTLTLSAANFHSGGFGLWGGSLLIGSVAGLGSGTLTLGWGTFSSNASTGRVVTNPVVVGGSVVTMGLSATSGSLTFSGSHYVYASGTYVTVGTVILSGALTGAGTLTKSGAGTLRLTGANPEFSGFVEMAAGTLRVAEDTAFGIGSLILSGGTFFSDNSQARSFSNNLYLNSASGTLMLGTASAIGAALTFAGPTVLLSSSTVWVTGTSAFTGVLEGSDTLTKAGSGILRITGSSPAFTGSVALTAGRLGVGQDTAFGSGAVVLSGGTFLSDDAQARNFSNDLYLNSASGTLMLGTASAAAGSLTFGGATTLLSSSTVWVTGTATFSGALEGSDMLTKAGAGTLRITGSSPAFTGSVALTAGRLGVGQDTAFGSGAVVLSGGTFLSDDAEARNFSNNLYLNSASGTLMLGTASAAGGSLTFGGATTLLSSSTVWVTGTATFSGALEGSDTLTKAGAGTLRITGSSPAFTGSVALTAGRLAVGQDTAFGSGAVVLSGGTFLSDDAEARNFSNDLYLNSASGTVMLGTSAAAGGALTFAGPTTLLSPSTLWVTGTAVFAGQISGIHSLNKTGSGTLRITAENTLWAGSVSLSTGPLQLGSDAALGTGSLWLRGGVLGSDSDTARSVAIPWWLSGDVTVGTSFAMGSMTLTGDGTLLSSSRLVTIGTTHLSGKIDGAGFLLSKSGSGTLTVTNPDNDLSGGIAVRGGTLEAAAGALGASGDITLASGTLRYGAGNTSDYSARLVLLGGSTGTVDTNEKDIFFSTAMGSGTAASFAKSGLGSLTLQGQNTYTGSTTVSAGSLTLTGGLVSNTLSIGSEAAFNWKLGASAVFSRLVGAGTVELNGNTLVLDSGNYSGVIKDGDGAGALVKNASDGSLQLTGTNTFSGSVTINAGMLIAANNSALGSGTIRVNTGTLTADGGNLRTLGNTVYLGASGVTLGTSGSLALSGSVYLSGDTTLHVLSSATLSGKVHGSGNFTKTGTGTLVMSTPWDGYGMNTLVDAGTLRITSSNFWSGTSSIMLNGGTFQFGTGYTEDVSARLIVAPGVAVAGIDTFGGNVTFANALGGTSTAALLKSGAGTLTLLADTGFAGGILLRGGSVRLSNSGVLGPSGNITFLGGALSYAPGNVEDFSPRFEPVSSTAAAIVDVGTNRVTFGTAISGTGGLTKLGSGVLMLGASNSYLGVTSVNAGALGVRDGNTLLSSSSLSVSNASFLMEKGMTFSQPISLGASGGTALGLWGGIVNLGGNNAITGDITLTNTPTFYSESGSLLVGSLGGVNRNIFLDGMGSGTLTGAVNSGSGALHKRGTGTWTLNSPDPLNYTGQTRLQGGTLVLDFSHMTTPTNLLGSNNVAVFNGGTLLIRGKSSGATSQTLATATLAIGPSQIRLDPNGGTSTDLVFTGPTTVVSQSDLLLTIPANSSVKFGAPVTPGTLLFGGRAVFSDGTGSFNFATTNGANTPTTAFSAYDALSTSGGVSTGTYALNGGLAITTSGSIGAIKIASTAASQALALSVNGSLRVASGALLFTGAHDYAITGGTIKSTSGNELLVHQYGQGSLTISSTVGNGAAASVLTKAGPGVVVLAGSNSYTGQTNIHAGILSISSNANLGAVATGAQIVIRGGSLQVTETFALDNNTANARQIRVGSASSTLDIADQRQLTVRGVVSGFSTVAAPLVKTGGGTLVLSATNTFAGGLHLLGGTVSVGADNNLGALNSPLTFNGGTLLQTAGFASNRSMVLAGPGWIRVVPGTYSTFTGWIRGDGSLTLTGGGTVALAGSNRYAGGTTVDMDAGTVAVFVNGVLGSGSVSLVSGSLLSDGSGTLASVSSIGVSGGTLRAVDFNSSGTLVVGGTGRALITGSSLVLSAANVVNTNTEADSLWFTATTGSVSLGSIAGSGSSRFSAGLEIGTISGGTLTVAGNAAVGTFSAGELRVNGGSGSIAEIWGGTLTLGATWVNVGSGSTSGLIQGEAGALLKDSAGTLALSGANTFGGGFTLANGTLLVGHDAALGVGSLYFAGGSLSSDSQTARVLANTLSLSGLLNAGDALRNGPLTLSGSGALVSSTTLLVEGSLTLSGSLSGAFDLVTGGAGELVLSGTNAFGGTTWVTGGTLTLAGGSALVDGMGVTVAAEGALQLAASETIGSLAGAGTVRLHSNTLTLSGHGSGVFSGSIEGVGGALTKEGTGVLTLSGINTFSGSARVHGGTVILNGGSALGDAVAVLVGGSGFLELHASETVGTVEGPGSLNLNSHVLTLGGSADTVFRGAIAGVGGALVKTGSAVFTLTHANTFDGGVFLNAGAIQVGDDVALGAGTLTLTAGRLSSDSGTARAVANALSLSGTFTLGDTIRNGSLDLSGDGVVFSDSVVTVASPVTMSGALSGSFQISKRGDAVWTFAGPNTLSGSIEVYAGTLAVTGAGSLTSGTVLVRGGTTFLTLGDTSQTVGRLHLVDGTVQSGTLAAGSFLWEKGWIRSVLTGPGGAQKISGETVTLTGANTLSGSIEISGGTLAVAGAGSLTSGTVVVSGGTTFLTLGDTSQTVGRLHLVDGTVQTGTLAAGAFLWEKGWISSALAGSGGAQKITGETVTLTGANTLSGSIEVGGGTLAVAGVGSLTSGTVLVSGGSTVLTLGSTDQTVGRLWVSSGTVEAGTLSAGSLYFESGVVSAFLKTAQSATKTSSGILTLTGTNTFASGLLQTGGTLRIGNDAALGVGSLLLSQGRISSDGTGGRTFANPVLLLGDAEFGDPALSGTLSLQGPVTLGGNRALTVLSEAVLSGTVSGSFSLGLTGPGVLTMNGSNTFSGGFFLASGTVRVGHDFALGSGSVTLSGGTLMNASPAGVRTLANAFVSSGTVTLGEAVNAGSLVVNGPLLLAGSTTFQIQSDVSANGPWRGAAGVIKEGARTLRLAGTNTFDGPVEIRNGTLVLAGGAALADAGEVRIAPNGAMVVDAAEQIGAVQGGGFVELRGGSLGIGGTAESVYTGSIFGVGGLTKGGSGILRLSGSNGFSGGASVSAGTLELGSDTALGTGTFTASGVRVSGDSGVSRSLQNLLVWSGTLELGDGVKNGALSFGGNAALHGDLALDVRSSVTLSGTVSGNFGLRKSGPAELVLSGTNVFAGSVQIAAGSLTLAGGAALVNTGSVMMETGATLRLAASEEIASVAGSGRVLLEANTLTLSGPLDSVFAGEMTGTGGLVKTSAATLTLSGENTFTGNTTVLAGSLRIGAGGTSGSLLGVGEIVNGGTLVFERSDTLTQGVGFGAISGTGNVIQAGMGTLVLSGTNTYTGNTAVEAGTLSLSSGVGLATGKISVKAGATLQTPAGFTFGSGSVRELELLGKAGSPSRILGNLAMAAGGTLSLGNAAALTYSTVAGNVTLTGGMVNLRIDQPRANGFGGDGLSVTGNVSLGAGVVKLTLSTLAAPGTTVDYGRYRIMEYTGSLSGYFTVDASQLNLEEGLKANVEYDTVRKRVNVLVTDGGGFVLGWGMNSTGALGGTVSSAALQPRQITGVPAPLQIAFGGGHSLMIDALGSLYAMGINTYGQLGEGNVRVSKSAVSNNVGYPVQFFSGRKVVSVAAGAQHSVAVTDDGRVYAWGSTANGRLGVGATTAFGFSYPTQVVSSGTLSGRFIRAVVSGGSSGAHTLALDSGGTLYAWGANDRGQLGVGDFFERTRPAMVAKVAGALQSRTVTMAAASTAHSMAVAGGTVFAWGRNSSGELGDGSQTDRTVPVAVTGGDLAGKSITMVAAGENHSLALDSDGNVYGWGANTFGQLGVTASTAIQSSPVLIASGSLAGVRVVAIAAGANHSLALTAEGGVFAWGNNSNGQLGNLGTVSSSLPQPASTRVRGFTGVVAAGNQSAALGGIYFSTQPTASAAVQGQSAVLSASAQLAGDNFNVRGPEIVYQWEPEGSTPTASSTSITVPSETFSVFASANYALVSMNCLSDVITITPVQQPVDTEPPNLVTPPVNSVAAVGGSVTLSLVTSGKVTSYLWERWDGGAWVPVPDGTNTSSSSTLNVPAVSPGRYRVTAENGGRILRDVSGNEVIPEVIVRSWADLAGTYQALMRNSASPSPASDSATDLRYPGRVTISVSATGSFSGSFEYQGASYALVGAFDPATRSCSINILRGSLPSIDLTLGLTDSDLQNSTLSVSATELLRTPNSTRVAWLEQSEASPISLKSAATLKRALGSTASVAGKMFSCVFRGSSATGPTAGGYSVFSVGSTGVVSCVARLGEGTDASTSLSNSGYLFSENVTAVYRSLYGVGQLAGLVQFRLVDETEVENNAVQSVDGDLEWKNPGVVSGITVTFPGNGFTLVPGIVVSGGSGSGAQGSPLVVGGRVIAITVSNPGYGYASVPDVRIVKSGAQPFNSSFRDAKATATVSPAFARKLTPYGSVYEAPTSVQAMTAAQMLGTASESVLSLEAFSNAGDVFLSTPSAVLWGLRDAAILKPTTSLTAEWSTSGGSQANAGVASLSLLTITPAASSPLRTVSFSRTSGTVSVPMWINGVVIQSAISSGGVVIPRGLYGVFSRDNLVGNEWCIR